MATMTMTFDVPETKSIDLAALKQHMQALFNVVVSMPSVLKKEQTSSVVDEFRGKWQDDNMTAEEFIREIRKNRESSVRQMQSL